MLIEVRFLCELIELFPRMKVALSQSFSPMVMLRRLQEELRCSMQLVTQYVQDWCFKWEVVLSLRLIV